MEQRQQNLKRHITILFTTENKLVNILSKLSQIARLFIRDRAEAQYVKCIKTQFNKNKHTKSKTLIRIIYLMDKLIKEYQTFRPYISQVICQLFVQLFSIFFQTNGRTEIEQMKMNRKAWATLISDDILENIKKEINRIYSFNIDSGFSKKKLSELKQYYTQKLKLTPQQCLKYLPDDSKKIQPQMQEHQDYTYYEQQPEPIKRSPILNQPQQKPKYPPHHIQNYQPHNVSNQYMNTQPMHPQYANSYGYPPMQIQNINTKASNTTFVFGVYPNNYNHQVFAQNSYGNYANMVDPMSYYNNQNPYYHAQMQNAMYQNKKQMTGNKYQNSVFQQNRNGKNSSIGAMSNINMSNISNNMSNISNISNISTSSSISNANLSSNINISKISNINNSNNYNQIYNSNNTDSFIKKPQNTYQSSIFQKYRELKLLGKYKCPRCGLQTSNRENYDIHLKLHYQQAKNAYEIVKKSQPSTRAPLLNLENWISFNQKQDQHEYFLQLQKITENYCKFCCNKFQPKWDPKIEKWVYKNVILVEINKKAKTTMHYACFNSLQEEVKSDIDLMLN